MYNEEMKKFKGPFWNGLTDKITLWTIDSEWSENRIEENYQLSVVRDLTLLNNYLNDVILSEDDYSVLVFMFKQRVLHKNRITHYVIF